MNVMLSFILVITGFQLMTAFAGEIDCMIKRIC